MLFFLEHAIQDASLTKSGERRVVSKRLLFVEIDAEGDARHLNYAPYLDYRPLAEGEPAVGGDPGSARVRRGSAATSRARRQAHAIAQVVPEHLAEVRDRKLELLDKTEAAVKDRLTKEINYWDFRAEQLKEQERAGKANARLNSGEARKRADELQARLQKRMEELKRERQLAPLPPVVLGGLLVVPDRADPRDGRAAARRPLRPPSTPRLPRRGRGRSSWRSSAASASSRSTGSSRSSATTSKAPSPAPGELRFIEVKGRVAGADTVTVTKNEILYSLNKPDDFILAMVAFGADGSHEVRYLRRPFHEKGVTTDFAGATVNFPFAQLLADAAAPS